MSQPLTRQHVTAALEMVKIVSDTIRDLGTVPSGELYAVLMPHMSLSTYERLLQLLKSAGVVTVSNHLITWVGPRA